MSQDEPMSASTRLFDRTSSMGKAPAYTNPSLLSAAALPTSSMRSDNTADTRGISFWYSKKQALLLLAALLVFARLFGTLVPPFQSPDEFNHLKRAYLLSKGVIVVGSRDDQTGANIDIGLLAYMDCYVTIPFNYGAKVDRAKERKCEDIHYTGTQAFSELSNTAMYFPALYAPQALALLAGRATNRSVGDSYYLARLFSLVATVAILLWALMTYSVPPAVIALFFMPMCLFQVSSTSLDAMSFATTVLAASLFMRGCDRHCSFSSTLHVALAVCLFLLATSRIVYIALSPLLLILYTARRSKIHVLSFVSVACASLTWIIFALNTVHGQGAITQEISSSNIIKYYALHPITFIMVVFRTLSDIPILRGFWQMFVGVLGWLDTPIGSAAYSAFAAELAFIMLVSNSGASFRSFRARHLALAGAAGAALLLLFLVALSAWTIHPASVVQGIQGRYLYPIVILFLFAFWAGRPSEIGINLSFITLFAVAASSMEFAVPRLIDRYYAH